MLHVELLLGIVLRGNTATDYTATILIRRRQFTQMFSYQYQLCN